MMLHNLTRFVKLSLLATWILFVGQILSSCGTVAPKPVESQSIAWNGNQENDGILGWNKDGTLQVDSFFVQTFNRRQAKFGKALSIQPLPKSTTRITKETLESSLRMASMERSQ